jgi:hypothetical protein
MRRTLAAIAGLVLVGGLVGCGQDSVEESNEQLCNSLSDLQAGVEEFRTMLTSGATRDELAIQLNSVSADTKNVLIDSKELAQSVSDDLNAAADDLKASVSELDAETVGDEQMRADLSAAADGYQAGVSDVQDQVGCSAE